MRVLWIANAINVTLGPCLVFGIGPFPRLGVTGAAIGTSIGRWTGVLIQIYCLTRKDGRIRIRWPHVRIDRQVMRGILGISGTATFQNFIGTASYMGLVRIISGFGSAAVAGNTIGIRVILFALLPSWGVSNAAVTLVGQNLGAGKPERAEASAWKAGLYNTYCLGSIGAIFLLAAPLIVSAFTQDAEVARHAIHCLRIVSAGFLFYGYGMVLTAAFNGAGDTRTPTLINLFSLWLLGDSPRLGAGVPARVRADRRVYRAQRRLLDDVLSERLAIQARRLENTARLKHESQISITHSLCREV